MESSTYEITCRLVQLTLLAFGKFDKSHNNDYHLLYCKLNFT